MDARYPPIAVITFYTQLFRVGYAVTWFPQQLGSCESRTCKTGKVKAECRRMEDCLESLGIESTQRCIPNQLSTLKHHNHFIKGAWQDWAELWWAVSQVSNGMSTKSETLPKIKKKKYSSSKQDGKHGKGYRMLNRYRVAMSQKNLFVKKRGRQKPNEARWKKKQTKDLLKAAEDARDKIRMAKGGRGAHTETLVCSDWFNIFVLQKILFYSSGELNRFVLFIKIYMFWTLSVYNPNYSVVQKHEYIQPSTPLHTFNPTLPPYKKGEK